MLISIEGCTPFEADPTNTTIYVGDTMFSGVYWEDEVDYAFIPEILIGNYKDVTDVLLENNIPVEEVVTYDLEAEPFCHMANGLRRIFRGQLDRYGMSDEG